MKRPKDIFYSILLFIMLALFIFLIVIWPNLDYIKTIRTEGILVFSVKTIFIIWGTLFVIGLIDSTSKR